MTCPICRAPELPLEERQITENQVKEATNYIKKKDENGFSQIVTGKYMSNEVKVEFIKNALLGSGSFFNVIATKEEMQLPEFGELNSFADKLRGRKKYDALLLLVSLILQLKNNFRSIYLLYHFHLSDITASVLRLEIGDAPKSF
jgi:hypothetical protein